MDRKHQRRGGLGLRLVDMKPILKDDLKDRDNVTVKKVFWCLLKKLFYLCDRRYTT